MRALTALLVHIEPRGTSPDINMTPAPFMPVTSALISQTRRVSTSAPSRFETSRETILSRRSPLTVARRRREPR